MAWNLTSSGVVGGCRVERDKAALVEEWVASLQGVQSNRVVFNDQGEIVELHVLSDDKRNPRQIVRDIETLLLVKLGINIDHKRISVVQFAKEQETGEERVTLHGISYKLHKGTAEVAVSLALGEKIAEVAVSGPASRQNQGRLVAGATLAALKKLLSGMVDFVVEDVTQLNFARGEVVVVGLSIVTPTGEETLVGSTFVRGEAKEAVVRATLSAVNRRFGQLMS